MLWIKVKKKDQMLVLELPEVLVFARAEADLERHAADHLEGDGRGRRAAQAGRGHRRHRRAEGAGLDAAPRVARRAHPGRAAARAARAAAAAPRDRARCVGRRVGGEARSSFRLPSIAQAPPLCRPPRVQRPKHRSASRTPTVQQQDRAERGAVVWSWRPSRRTTALRSAPTADPLVVSDRANTD